jgi:O-antigen/teichoic acid export membrane protein
MSVRKGAATLGGATVLGHLAQFAWLGLGSRTMSPSAFGAILAAQALYGFLQIVVDNGPGFYGARLAARGGVDSGTRASLVRLRLQLALGGSALTLAIGAAAGTASLRANAAFAAALILFAALNYWEPYGRGDVRPWSAYVALRSVAPAAAALALLTLGRAFPLELAGVVECAVVGIVAACFRLSSRRDLVGALSASPGPWRGVTRIGLPVVVGQLGFAGGTILLNAIGAPTAAAAFAVGLRLVTGLNQLTGTLAAALFPRLAQGPGARDDDGRGIVTAVRALLTLTFAAAGVVMLWPSLVTSVFLSHAGTSDDAGVICLVAASCATGFIVLFTLVLLARNGERAFLAVYGTATAAVVGGGLVVAVASPASPLVGMATVFALGQTAGMAVLARFTVRALAVRRRTVVSAAAGALLLSLTGLLAATVPDVRPVAGVATILAALAAAAAPAMRRLPVAPAAETARSGL